MKSKINFNKKLCIVGNGGFAREVLCLLLDVAKNEPLLLKNQVHFMHADSDYSQQTIMGIKTISHAQFNPQLHQIIIGIANSKRREEIVNELPPETEYATLIHPNAIISDWVEIGDGSVIAAGCILTCNIKIGCHAQLNLQTTIGHDCIIEDYFTTAPAVNISGICHFGKHVYFGSNASVRQNIKICNNATIGMGAVVVKNIIEEGIYVGNPAKKMVK